MRTPSKNPVNEWLRRLEGQLNVEQLIQGCCQALLELSGADRCSIMVLDSSTEELTVRWAQGVRVKPYGTMRFRVGEGLCGSVARSQQPLFSFDVSKEKRFLPPSAAGRRFRQVRSMLCLPLVNAGRTVGVVNLTSFSANQRFRQAKERLPKRFLDRLAQVIEQATLLQEADANSKRWRNMVKTASNTVAQVSHEVRTPLTLIMEGTQQLLDGYIGKLTTGQEERLNVIKSQAGRMLKLVTELLDLSRIEAGRMALYRRSVDLTELIEEVKARYEPLIFPREMNLKLGPVPEVYGDRNRLSQVIENLLTNAVKFTPPDGSITFTLQVRGQSAELAVSDTGIGISKKEQRRLFEKFFQPKRMAGVNERGTGLGLVIVKEIVQLHGGTVRVDSEPGKGAAFTVSIPLYTPSFALTEEYRVVREQAAREGSALAFQLFQGEPNGQIMWQEVKELLQRHVSKEDRVLVNPGGGLVILSITDPSGLQAMRHRLDELFRAHSGIVHSSSIRWGWAWVPEEGIELAHVLRLAQNRAKDNLVISRKTVKLVR